MNTSIPRIPPPVFFLVGIVVMALLNSYFPIGRWLHYPWRYLGIIFLVLGFSLGLSSGLYFRRLGTNPRPGAKATLIVTTGPFKYKLSRLLQCPDPLAAILLLVAVLLFFLLVVLAFV